jgi:multidrug efflux pump subunit AcrA (membrane-fusion protein)
MLLLRVAEVDQVRLQAYATQADLQWLRVGDPVEARDARLPGGVLQARVTSIFPAADPTTRTAIVEALVANPGEILAPGETVSLTITTSQRPNVLTVPTSALVYLPVPGAAAGAPQQAAVWVAAETAAGGKTIYTCPMHPQIQSDKPGTCPLCGMPLVPKAGTGAAAGVKTAHQIKVTLGASDGERTEITSGLCAGQQVIFRGQTDLREGDAVYVVPWAAQGPTELPPAPGATPATPATPSMPGMKMGSSAFFPPPPRPAQSAAAEGAGGEALRLLVRLLFRGRW